MTLVAIGHVDERIVLPYFYSVFSVNNYFIKEGKLDSILINLCEQVVGNVVCRNFRHVYVSVFHFVHPCV